MKNHVQMMYQTLDPLNFKISFYKSSVNNSGIILPATKMVKQN